VHYWGEPFHNQIVGPPRANRIDAKYITQGVTRVWQSPLERVLGPQERVSVDDAASVSVSQSLVIRKYCIAVFN
jgi:hypothetical protein